MGRQALHVHFSTSELPVARFSRAVPEQTILFCMTPTSTGGRFQFVLEGVTEDVGDMWLRSLEKHFGGATVQEGPPILRGEYDIPQDALPGFVGPMMMGVLHSGDGAFVRVRGGALDVYGFGELEKARQIFQDGLKQTQQQGEIKITELDEAVETEFGRFFKI
jgi:hypothetical protein